MSPPPPAPSKARTCSVTVSHLNGQLRAGKITNFDPSMTDLPLVVGDGGTRVFVPAETVAYVAFHRGSDERPAPEGEAIRVTLSDGQTFRVRGRSAGAAVGFFAAPDDASSPFACFFFYQAAVRRVERAAPIGDLLVARGSVRPDQVDRAVATQAQGRAATLGEILIEQHKVSPEAVQEAVSLQARRGVRIGEILVEAGVVTEQDVAQALEEQRRRRGRRLGEILVSAGALSELALAKALAVKFHLPFEDLDRVQVDPAAVALLPRPLIEKQRVLPIAFDDKTLTVAIADPLAVNVLDTAMIHSRRRLREVVAVPSQIERRIADHFGPPSDLVDAIDDLREEPPPRLGAGPRSTFSGTTPRDEADDDGVIRIVNQILLDAWRRGASDIHFEPAGLDRPTVVRLRIDGDCQRYHELPGAVGLQAVTRLKIMANLDIAERRRAQDGKLKVQGPDRAVEFRLATVPTVNQNEDAVLRVLSDSRAMPLHAAGLSQGNLVSLKELVARPYGLLLCVGPTGSGKTTTLHALLGHINTPDMKIWTAEDPVEITQPGLRQVQVHRKIGVTFASALRTFLRADPDVIMVGEMRDEETATIAVEASLTGHLVLSTLHTNSAPETITRLLDMGVDPFSFSDALLGVLAQRLVRALCPSCKFPARGNLEAWERYARAYGVEAFEAMHPYDDDFMVWTAPGCRACRDTGYKGRMAIHELLTCDDAMRHALARRTPADELRGMAVANGMITLVQDGVEKCLEGKTDLAQVLSVAQR